MDLAGVIAVVIGLGGLAGVVFTALSWRRNDTSAIVQQQSTILHDIQAVNAELRQQVSELKDEIGRLRQAVGEHTGA